MLADYLVLIVLLAPHVGLTEEGGVGKVHRHGQDHSTSACGAAVGAYNLLKKDPTANTRTNENDFQQDYIVKALAPHMEEILAASGVNARQTLLANKMHDIASQFLDEIVDLKWMGPNSKLVILSGLMINVDGASADVFEPLSFTIQGKDGKKTDMTENFSQGLVWSADKIIQTPLFAK